VVLASRGKEAAEDQTQNRNQMRMYSFKQLFNIINTTANQSEVSDRLLAAEKNIDKIFKELANQKVINQ
jgi:hypothetical protein